MSKVLEKVERRLGEKLFIKGERCAGPKCALTRRGYPPGVHGKSRRRRRGASEYGELLREKQKVRILYGLDDKDVIRYSKEAASKSGIFNSNFIELLERRLDNVLFRLGFAMSRRGARQMVSHGHIEVNGKMVTAPSYRVRKGDTVRIKDRARSLPVFVELEIRLKKYEAPLWLKLDVAKREGDVIRLPVAEDIGVGTEFTKIKEFYSR